MSDIPDSEGFKKPDAFLKAPERLLSYLVETPKGIRLRAFERSLRTLASPEMPALIENRKELSRIDERSFEELVADLIRADGYGDIQLVSRVNAPGPGIIVRGTHPLGGEQQFIVECKRWKNKVGIEAVRGIMYRVDNEYRATGGILVTTSDFTRNARDEAKRLNRWRLTLKDGTDVLEWLKKNSGPISEKWVRRADPMASKAGVATMDLLREQKDSKLALSESPCQICGGYVLCGYNALSTASEWWHDHHFHVCIECLQVEHEIKRVHDMIWGAHTDVARTQRDVRSVFGTGTGQYDDLQDVTLDTLAC